MTTTQTKIPERGTKQFRQYAAEVMASDGPWQCKYASDPEDPWEAVGEPIWNWDRVDYRIAVPPPQPVVKPWTFENAPMERLRVRRKSDGMIFVAECQVVRIALFGKECFSVDYELFARDFEQLDGSPCGTLEEKREWYTQPSGFKDGTAVIRIDQDDSVHLISKKGYDTVASHTAERVREMYTRITAAEAAELLRGKEVQAC